jgi:predicted phosphodiesterase
MRILVISDVHANLTALEAVLSDAGPFDAAWCLGDVVGYGPDPDGCIQRIRELPGLTCIMGNHDAAVLRLIDVDTFNPEARAVIYWTQYKLSESSLNFLEGLQEREFPLQRAGNSPPAPNTVTLAHGSPRHPVWEYLLDSRTATANFAFFDTTYCFVGHTHLPVIYHLQEGQPLARLAVPEPGKLIQLARRCIINPGSVGQPRDRDPRAAYGIYDTQAQTWAYRRVAYDIPAVQSRMLAAGLPERHIQRLSAGW